MPARRGPIVRVGEGEGVRAVLAGVELVDVDRVPLRGAAPRRPAAQVPDAVGNRFLEEERDVEGLLGQRRDVDRQAVATRDVVFAGRDAVAIFHPVRLALDRAGRVGDHQTQPLVGVRRRDLAGRLIPVALRLGKQQPAQRDRQDGGQGDQGGNPIPRTRHVLQAFVLPAGPPRSRPTASSRQRLTAASASLLCSRRTCAMSTSAKPASRRRALPCRGIRSGCLTR